MKSSLVNILGQGLLALTLSVSASAQPVALSGAMPLPHPAVVLFWASWCVPCRAELRRLPDLVRAAQPLPVVTLALDPPAVARATLVKFGLSTSAAFADARPPAVVLREWGGEGASLPLAVALDAAGAPCGRKRGLLGTDQLHEWAARCSR